MHTICLSTGIYPVLSFVYMQHIRSLYTCHCCVGMSVTAVLVCLSLLCCAHIQSCAVYYVAVKQHCSNIMYMGLHAQPLWYCMICQAIEHKCYVSF